jgi:hypothetical protein
MLLCYKSPEAWQRRERPEKVVRVDYPDGYVEVTGMMSLQHRQYYCLTLCYRSITTGELKQLKLRSLQLVEENVNKLSRARTVPASRRVCAHQTAGWRLRHLAAFQTERSGLCAPRLPHHADHRDGTRRLASATLAHRLLTLLSDSLRCRRHPRSIRSDVRKDDRVVVVRGANR